VLGDCAKRAASETAPVSGQGKLDNLKGRYGFFIGGVGFSCKRQFVDPVHFPFIQGAHWHVLHNHGFGVGLDNVFSFYRVLFQKVHPEGFCKGGFVLRNFGKGGDFHAFFSEFFN